MHQIVPLHQNHAPQELSLLNPFLLKQMEYFIQKINTLELKISEMNTHLKVDSAISFSLQDGITRYQQERIIRCEAAGNYTTIFALNEKPLVVSQTLKTIEKRLESTKFIRLHAGHLVNKSMIRKLIRIDGMRAELQDGSTLPVSRRKWPDVVRVFSLYD